MTIRVRFAPSPTGTLHIGSARAALITWLFARKNQGDFMLRIDDTDQERSKEEYVDDIQCALKWMGMDWDRSARQSERTEKYDAAIQKLKDSGRLYPCYETKT
jgi:glutamyl-tRNA synthetase